MKQGSRPLVLRCEKRAWRYGPQRKEDHLARIAGVNIPTPSASRSRSPISTGIGHTSAQQICDAVGIDQTRRVNELSDAEVLRSASTSTPTSPSKATCAAKCR
jgi:hypothetical protein